MEAMASQRTASSRRGAGKWLIVVLLSVIATCLLVEVGRGVPPARAEVSTAQSGEIIAVAGKVTGESYGLYLLDLRHGTISVYQYLASKRTLRLMAVRNYTFDVQLDEYNTEPPPREIKKLVQQSKRLRETN
jgi:hypothetical protein